MNRVGETVKRGRTGETPLAVPASLDPLEARIYTLVRHGGNMKASFHLPILALIGLAGCAAQPTNVATTTKRQAMWQPPPRIFIENHTPPREVWGATSAVVGKDSP